MTVTVAAGGDRFDCAGADKHLGSDLHAPPHPVLRHTLRTRWRTRRLALRTRHQPSGRSGVFRFRPTRDRRLHQLPDVLLRLLDTRNRLEHEPICPGESENGAGHISDFFAGDRIALSMHERKDTPPLGYSHGFFSPLNAVKERKGPRNRDKEERWNSPCECTPSLCP